MAEGLFPPIEYYRRQLQFLEPFFEKMFRPPLSKGGVAIENIEKNLGVTFFS